MALPPVTNESMGLIWLLWFVSATLLVLLTSQRRDGWRRRSLRHLVKGEEGASYVLSVTLVLPIYTLLVCLIVECTLMLIVKTGTLYAAYAAARSAIVWVPAESDGSRLSPLVDPVQEAAVIAMTPFASGSRRHAAAVESVVRVRPGLEDTYVQAYRDYANGSATEEYLRRKLRYAHFAVRHSIERVQHDRADEEFPEFLDSLRVTVSYDKPFNVPIIGRLLGRRTTRSGLLVRRIESTVTLQEEAPQSRDRKLGIRYDSAAL